MTASNWIGYAREGTSRRHRVAEVPLTVLSFNHMKLIQSLVIFTPSLLLLAGCNQPAANSSPVKPDAAIAASPAAPAVDQGPLNLIDLSIFSRLDGATDPLMKSATMVMYVAPGKPVEGYNTIKEQLIAERWQVQPGEHLSVEYGSASGTFEHHGYLLGVSTSRDSGHKPAGVSVTLIHHGQVDWKNISLPADAKQDYAVGTTAGYVTESSVEDTMKNTRASFQAAGWQPYEESPGVVEFKKGRQLLHLYISSAPAKMGKTMIQVSPKLMAADIPVPPDAIDQRYHDAPAKLSFAHTSSWDEVAKFYQDALPKLGWQPTTDSLIKNETDVFQIFRNPKKAYLEVKLETRGEKSEVEVVYKSAGQFEADEKRYREAMEKKKAKNAIHRDESLASLNPEALRVNVFATRKDSRRPTQLRSVVGCESAIGC